MMIKTLLISFALSISALQSKDIQPPPLHPKALPAKEKLKKIPSKQEKPPTISPAMRIGTSIVILSMLSLLLSTKESCSLKKQLRPLSLIRNISFHYFSHFLATFCHECGHALLAKILFKCPIFISIGGAPEDHVLASIEIESAIKKTIAAKDGLIDADSGLIIKEIINIKSGNYLNIPGLPNPNRGYSINQNLFVKMLEINLAEKGLYDTLEQFEKAFIEDPNETKKIIRETKAAIESRWNNLLCFAGGPTAGMAVGINIYLALYFLMNRKHAAYKSFAKGIRKNISLHLSNLMIPIDKRNDASMIYSKVFGISQESLEELQQSGTPRLLLFFLKLFSLFPELSAASKSLHPTTKYFNNFLLLFLEETLDNAVSFSLD